MSFFALQRGELRGVGGAAAGFVAHGGEVGFAAGGVAGAEGGESGRGGLRGQEWRRAMRALGLFVVLRGLSRRRRRLRSLALCLWLSPLLRTAA